MTQLFRSFLLAVDNAAQWKKTFLLKIYVEGMYSTAIPDKFSMKCKNALNVDILAYFVLCSRKKKVFFQCLMIH